MNADGSGEHRIRTAGRRPAWSPDGTKIVFVDGSPARLHIMNADGTGAVQLAVDSDGGQDGALAYPNWSPDGQRIAYVDYPSSDLYGLVLYVANVDGSDRRPVYRVPEGIPGRIVYPDWLPDGGRIAYVRTKPADNFEHHVLTIRPDGTGEVDLGRVNLNPLAWSPDGTFFAIGQSIYRADGSLLRHLNLEGNPIESWQPVPSSAPNLSVRMYTYPEPVYQGDSFKYTIFVKHVSGSQAADSVVLTDTVPDTLPVEWVTSSQGSCSREGQTVRCALGTIGPGAEAAVAISTTWAAGLTNTNSASAQAANGDPDPLNNADSKTTDVWAGSGFPRPKSAATLDISLVPAYAPCTNGNRSHGPPLAFESCNPPAQASSYLTVGTPDANQLPAQSDSSEHVRAIPANPQTGAPADVRFSVSATDVRRRSDLADYTGELQVAQALRITDKLNNGVRGTMTDYAFRFTMPCTSTPSTTEGAACGAMTTADALIPNSVRANIRSVWEWGQVRVFDGGADGVAATDDNSVFLTQGFFVP